MPGIVWLASYPKSGNTWLRAFLCNLLANEDHPLSINSLHELVPSASNGRVYQQFTDKDPAELTPEELARIRPLVHRAIADRSSQPVFLKTHTFLGTSHGVPTITPEATAGAIYIVRNPLDVCQSLSGHNRIATDIAVEGMGDDYAEQRSIDAGYVNDPVRSWSINVKSWTRISDPKVKVVRYEDMVNDEYSTFQEIAEFLGLGVSENQIRKALKFSSIDELRKQEKSTEFVERNKTSSEPFFGEGRTGQWKSKLSPDQVKKIVDVHREQMARFDYVPAEM